MHPILDIQHATVYHGDTCVFSNFSFALHEGERSEERRVGKECRL